MAARGCAKVVQGFTFLFIPMIETTIYENIQWKVIESGDLICKDNSYEISRNTLESIDWETHLSEKNWCNKFYFKQALDYSLKHTI